MSNAGKIYCGYRLQQVSVDGLVGSRLCVVTVEEAGRPARPLDLRLDLRNHSPTGFDWGYGGSGPAQLALALAAEEAWRLSREAEK